MLLKVSPVFPVFPEPFALFPQTCKVHLGLQCHEEGARIGDLQIKPQTWEQSIRDRQREAYYVPLSSYIKTVIYTPINTTEHKAAAHQMNNCECYFGDLTRIFCLVSNCCEVPCRGARERNYPLAKAEKVSSASSLAEFIGPLPDCPSYFPGGEFRFPFCLFNES